MISMLWFWAVVGMLAVIIILLVVWVCHLEKHIDGLDEIILILLRDSSDDSDIYTEDCSDCDTCDTKFHTILSSTDQTTNDSLKLMPIDFSGYKERQAQLLTDIENLRDDVLSWSEKTVEENYEEE